MAVTPKRLVGPAQLTTAVQTLYTVPANAQYSELIRIILTNITASQVKAYVYVVPSGGAAGPTNALITDYLCDIQGMPYVIPVGIVLNPGDTIQAKCDTANALNILGSGLEVI